MLSRTHVSRMAAGKARALLEGVGLDTPTIDACFSAHPLDEEGAVQKGLTRWAGGKGTKPPTWEVLIAAMKYAQFEQQCVKRLEKVLGLPEGMLILYYDIVGKLALYGECGYGESVIYSNHTKLLLLENETHFIVILYR